MGKRIVREQLVAQPTGGVVFDEEYPDDVDIWAEPEPEPEAVLEEEKKETVITTRRKVFRRKVQEEPPAIADVVKDKEKEEEEEISEPEEYIPEERVPVEWRQFAAETEEEAAVIQRQIVRQPVVEVSSRKVYRKLDIREEVEKAGISEKRIVEEELVAEPAGGVAFDEEYPDDVDIWAEPEPEPEPEPEAEKEETVITTRRQVFRRKVPEEPLAIADVLKDEDKEEVLVPPRRVERLYVRRILRKEDGTEKLLDKSESVVPFDSIGVSEEEDEGVGDEKDEDST